MLGTVLLLSVVLFSLTTSAHWLWHGADHDSCRDTAHSCRNETLGNRHAAWQLPAHPQVDFSGHHFQCPVCSGVLGIAEAPARFSALAVAVPEVWADLVCGWVPLRFYLPRAARGPPRRV